MTTEMTAGVDVTGHPSLDVDCQRGRPTHSRSDTCTRVIENICCVVFADGCRTSLTIGLPRSSEDEKIDLPADLAVFSQ